MPIQFRSLLSFAIACGTFLPLNTAFSFQGQAGDNIFTQVSEIAPVAGAPEPTPAPTAKGNPFAKTPTTKWIWGPDDNKSYVISKTVTLNGASAIVRTSCDNYVSLAINGKKVAENGEWSTPVSVDITKHLVAGENKIEATVRNEGGPAAFILQMAFKEKGSDSWKHVVTDGSWAVKEADSGKAANTRELITLGGAPWNDVFSNTGGASSSEFHVPHGFQVERLFTVPKNELGSWVCITTDAKGRLIVSDQENKGLCRITPPALTGGETKVERLQVNMSGAQGMLWAFDSLYVSANGGPGSGLYRLQDKDGDDQFEVVDKLLTFRGGGEHGPHSLQLSPDGKSIYVIIGNHVDVPDEFAAHMPKNWNEDHLLPRQWDANGHAVGRLAPGGWIAKCDPDGKNYEIVSMGYRNPFDFDFNADGEIFAYDADMEWDMGSPWYRPTRVVHATIGSEFGWRSGTGKWPTYYEDSLPPAVDIGPGSPVGVTFGYGAKFPAKYQKALFILDWTFGTIYSIHFTPMGSSYEAKKEQFVGRTPLPLTDAVIGNDGAMYFLIGGRGTQSELYRVTYVGQESTAPVDAHDKAFAEERALRRSIEATLAPEYDWKSKGIETPEFQLIWKSLGSDDRQIRFAARVALELNEISKWRDAFAKVDDPQAIIECAIALAHQGTDADADLAISKLQQLKYGSLSEDHQLQWLRALSLVFIRLGAPKAEVVKSLVAELDPHFPSDSKWENRELCAMLVYLESPTIIEKTLALMKQTTEATEEEISEILARNPGYGNSIKQMMANRPDAQNMHYAFVLRNKKLHWTIPQRIEYFQWFKEAKTKSGGASYVGFLRNMANDAYEHATDSERLAIETSGARDPYVAPELPKPVGPGKEYSLQAVVDLAGGQLKGRNFENGKKTYQAARCVVCHRYTSDGGATGPDLTQVAGRFSYKDLAEAIVDPNKVISDQYKLMAITTSDGASLTGRIVSETKTHVTVLTDPENSSKFTQIDRESIESMVPATTSAMPAGLLNQLNEDEVLDLMAYLLSRGDPNAPVFKK